MQLHIISYLALAGAIICEVTGTACLQKSAQFTKLAPMAIMAVFYILSFYLLSIALRTLPLGVAYAVWVAWALSLLRSSVSSPSSKHSTRWQFSGLR